MTDFSLMSVLAWLGNVFFHGLCGYPLLLLLVFLVMLILWGGAGRGFGLPALFWHEQAVKQLAVGLALGMLLTQIGFVAFLMDNRVGMSGVPTPNRFYLSQSGCVVEFHSAPGGLGNPPVVEVTLTDADGERATDHIPMDQLADAHLHPWISTPPLLFFLPQPDQFEEHVTWVALVWYLLGVWLWIGGLWLLGTGLMAVWSRWRSQAQPRRMSATVRLPWFPLVIGVGGAVALTAVFLCLAWWVLWLEPRLQGWSLVAPGLHLLAAGSFGLTFGGFWLLRLDRRANLVSPAVSICVLLGWVAGLYGFIVFWSAQARLLAPEYVPSVLVSPWLWLTVLGLIAIAINCLARFKYRFPGLEPLYQAGQQVKLSAYSSEPRTALLSPDQVAWPCDGLRSLPTRDKPKLAVVCVSGGGVRAAVWAAVLTRLEEAYANFPYHVRLVTGASGGMVGAAYYVATLNDPLDSGTAMRCRWRTCRAGWGRTCCRRWFSA